MQNYINNLNSGSSSLSKYLNPGVKSYTPTANVGATSTAPITNSPAKQQFMQSLTASTPPSVSQTQPTATNVTTPSGAVVNSTTGQAISLPQPDKNQGYNDAYSAYIKSLTPSQEETTSSKNLSDLQLQSQKEQSDALERPGDTLGGADLEANRINRNYAFGIDAESNRLNALTGARTATTNATKARADFEKGLLDSSSADAKEKFTEDLATKNYDLSAKNADQTKLSADRTFEENKRQFGLDYAQKEQQIAIDQQKVNQTDPGVTNATQIQGAQQSATNSIGIVNNLLSGDAYKSITGAIQNPLNALGLANQKAIKQYDQLQGLLKLGARSLIKGQGAVSDYEGTILGQAASDLDRHLSNEDFAQALKKIRGVIKTNNGGSTNVIVKDENGKVRGQGDLTGKDIYDAVNAGDTIEYQ